MTSMYRKCEKCGKKRVQDMSVTYHRFPVPGPKNIAKARAWAKFCWPDTDFDTEQLRCLNRSSKMLCGRHFKYSDFYDSEKQKLSIFAIPSVSGEQESVAAMTNKENKFDEDIEQPLIRDKKRQQLSEQNNLLNVAYDYKIPSTSIMQSSPEGPLLSASNSSQQLSKRRTWLSKIKLQGKFYANAKMCNLHFRKKYYNPERPGHLLDNALPFYSSKECNCITTPRKFVSAIQSSKPPSKDLQAESSHQDCACDTCGITIVVVTKDEPPKGLEDPKVQKKTPRELSMEKNIKVLKQIVTLQKQKINQMESLISLVKNYTSQSEIDNILQGNFDRICKEFNQEPKSKKVKYSDEVKAFALTVNRYSPKTYEYLRTIISLPHPVRLA